MSQPVYQQAPIGYASPVSSAPVRRAASEPVRYETLSWGLQVQRLGESGWRAAP